MENKEVKTWVVWLFAIISILIIGPFCFFLGKQFSNKEHNEEVKQEEKEVVSWEEENEVISLASDYEYLYLLENNKEVKIGSISRDNSVYFYEDEKAYVFEFSYDTRKGVVGYYDFHDNQKYTKLFDVPSKSSPESIIVLDGHVYVTTTNDAFIYDYDIEKKDIKELNYFDDYFEKLSYGSFLLYRTSNGKVIYWTRGSVDVDAEIGVLDIKTGKKNMIASDVYLEYVYGDKVICKQYSSKNGKAYDQYFEYDASNGSGKQISGLMEDIGGAIPYSLIVPYQDYYVYAYDSNVYQYKDGKEEVIAHVDDLYIGTITLVSYDTVLITNDADMCLMGECDLISYRLNLDTKELTEDKDNERLYAYVSYIK